MAGLTLVPGSSVFSSDDAPRYFGPPDWWMPELSCCVEGAVKGTFWSGSDERHYLPSEYPWRPAAWPTVETSRNVIWLINYNNNPPTIDQTYTWTPADQTSEIKLNDMEAMASDGAGGLFVMTSQSLTSHANNDYPDAGYGINRSRLAHFKAGSPLTWQGYVEDMRGKMITKYSFLTNCMYVAPKNREGIDIEGMAYDPVKNKMWIGFRSPLVCPSDYGKPGSNALIIVVTNVLDSSGNINTTPAFAERPITLDLGGLGIRDLYYDTLTNNWLYILSGKVEGNLMKTDPDGNTYRATNACHILAYNVANGKLSYCRTIPQVSDPWTASYTGNCEAEGMTSITINGQRRMLITHDSKVTGVCYTVDFPDPTKFTSTNSAQCLFGM